MPLHTGMPDGRGGPQTTRYRALGCGTPSYLVLVYAFVRRRNWIRMPALLCGAAMFYSIAVYVLMEIFNEHAADTNLPMVLLIGAP